MKVTILSQEGSWVRPFADKLSTDLRESGHDVTWTHDSALAQPGDVCFLLSWERVVPPDFRAKFSHTIVVHASSLPLGRGWSPLTWQILEGKNDIVVSLLEADAAVDSGVIYLQETVKFQGNELLAGLQTGIGYATVGLCRSFVQLLGDGPAQGRSQDGSPTYYKRRTPRDSQIDPNRSIAEQFDLLRVVDNMKYPAWFDFRGMRYTLMIQEDSRPGFDE